MGAGHGFVFKHGKRIYEQEMWGASRSRGGRRNRFLQRLCRKQYVQQEGLQASDLAVLEAGQWPQQQQEREGTNTGVRGEPRFSAMGIYLAADWDILERVL